MQNVMKQTFNTIQITGFVEEIQADPDIGFSVENRFCTCSLDIHCCSCHQVMPDVENFLQQNPYDKRQGGPVVYHRICQECYQKISIQLTPQQSQERLGKKKKRR